ncbi:FAD binding domain-containing protein [Frigidibacter sp. ROC022]|uniref:FAD binding domain-containing protein n=1 Tax=Frigidibacter sp. ROC022 TaxID=2971796 RepID=UPI00215ADB19|nr:FAD binding domain-containing protein [Frigidibacter sp. ROC022]MCR8726490.1 FAD binding domain-containing protein [Frigidibacter sp. ROC022]
MKPAPFELSQPGTLDDARGLLAAGDADCRIIAGGQSLGPMLNLRLARPDRLVALSALPGLTECRETESHVEIGAAVTHARIEDGDCPEPIPGMLRHVAAGIAYRAVRNRGTIGGSLCHADPAADWVTAMTALGATLLISGEAGTRREVPMRDFMQGAYRTALKPGEILTTVRIPRYSAGARWGYYKICRKVGEFADAISAFVADPETRVCRVVFGSTGGAPLERPALARQLAETGAAAPLDEIKKDLLAAQSDLSPVKLQQMAIAHQRSVQEALSHD